MVKCKSDQDKIQLTQIIGAVKNLRKQNDLFYTPVRKATAPENRDWLYLRVKEEYDGLDNQLQHLRASIDCVYLRAQRLLDLVSLRLAYQSGNSAE